MLAVAVALCLVARVRSDDVDSNAVSRLGTSGAKLSLDPQAPALSSDRSRPVRGARYSELVASRRLDPAATSLHGDGTFSIERHGYGRWQDDMLPFATAQMSASENGDAIASYELFLVMHECRSLMHPGGYVSEQTKARLIQCEGLLASSEVTDTNWLERAAQQGSVEAMLMYGVNPRYTLGDASDFLRDPEAVSQWKQRAARYLHDAAAMGSLDALLSLSSAYGNGVIVDADPVRAYAYLLAASAISQGPYTPELLEMNRRELSRREQTEGQRLADQIRRNCCVSQPGG